MLWLRAGRLAAKDSQKGLLGTTTPNLTWTWMSLQPELLNQILNQTDPDMNLGNPEGGRDKECQDPNEVSDGQTRFF